MPLAIEAIVAQYVKRDDLSALEKLRSHREGLLSRMNDRGGYSFDLVRDSCKSELVAIDGAIEEVLGDCRGEVDADRTRIFGWVQYTRHPARRVTVGIYINRSRIAEVVADRFRSELLKDGIGDGCHGFEFVPPEGSFAPPVKLGLRFGKKLHLREFNVI